MNTEDTILNDETTVVSQSTVQTPSESGKKKLKLNKVAAVAAAAGGGIGSVFAAAITGDDDADVEEPVDDVIGSESEDVVAESVNEEPVVNDDMSFGEAFASARAAYGSGGVFEWRGNTYNTYTREELEARTAEEAPEANAEVAEDVVSAEVEDVVDEIDSDDVQVIGVDADDAIIIDDNESAFVAEVDEVYVEVYDDSWSDTSFETDSFISDDPVF